MCLTSPAIANYWASGDVHEHCASATAKFSGKKEALYTLQHLRNMRAILDAIIARGGSATVDDVITLLNYDRAAMTITINETLKCFGRKAGVKSYCGSMFEICGDRISMTREMLDANHVSPENPVAVARLYYLVRDQFDQSPDKLFALLSRHEMALNEICVAAGLTTFRQYSAVHTLYYWHLTGTQWCQASDVAEHAGTSSKRLLAAIDRVACGSRPIFELRTSLLDGRRKEIRLSVDMHSRLRSLHEIYNRQFGRDINVDVLQVPGKKPARAVGKLRPIVYAKSKRA